MVSKQHEAVYPYGLCLWAVAQEILVLCQYVIVLVWS